MVAFAARVQLALEPQLAQLLSRESQLLTHFDFIGRAASCVCVVRVLAVVAQPRVSATNDIHLLNFLTYVILHQRIQGKDEKQNNIAAPRTTSK